MHKSNLLIASLLLTTGCLSDEAYELDADDVETSEVESAATVYNWSDDTPISALSSAYQVGLASLGGRVHMVYTTSYGYLSHARFDGFFWTGASPLPSVARADYGPALVNHGSQLVLVYHARGENRLMMSTSSGSSWTNPVTVGSTLGGATILNAPAAVSHGGNLYIGYCTRTSAGDFVRIDRRDGTAWTKIAELNAAFRCKHVALASLPDGKLDIIATVESGNTGDWYMFEWDGVGEPTSGWQRDMLPMKSKKPVSIATCGGISHLVHGGFSTPREIWWTVREGGSWLGDSRIPNQASEGGSSLACWNDRTIMVHNGGDSQLWYARYSE